MDRQTDRHTAFDSKYLYTASRNCRAIRRIALDNEPQNNFCIFVLKNLYRQQLTLALIADVVEFTRWRLYSTAPASVKSSSSQVYFFNSRIKYTAKLHNTKLYSEIYTVTHSLYNKVHD